MANKQPKKPVDTAPPAAEVIGVAAVRMTNLSDKPINAVERGPKDFGGELGTWRLEPGQSVLVESRTAQGITLVPEPIEA